MNLVQNSSHFFVFSCVEGQPEDSLACHCLKRHRLKPPSLTSVQFQTTKYEEVGVAAQEKYVSQALLKRKVVVQQSLKREGGAQQQVIRREGVGHQAFGGSDLVAWQTHCLFKEDLVPMIPLMGIPSPNSHLPIMKEDPSLISLLQFIVK